MANPSRGGDAKPRGSRSQPGHRRAVLLGRSDRRISERFFIVRRLFGASAEALIIVILVIGLLAVPVLGAKGGGQGGGGKPSGGGTGTIGLAPVVSDANSDGLPNWGDTVTFDISTTATTTPYVHLRVPPERDVGPQQPEGLLRLAASVPPGTSASLPARGAERLAPLRSTQLSFTTATSRLCVAAGRDSRRQASMSTGSPASAGRRNVQYPSSCQIGRGPRRRRGPLCTHPWLDQPSVSDGDGRRLAPIRWVGEIVVVGVDQPEVGCR